MSDDPKRPMYDGIGIGAVILAFFIGMSILKGTAVYIDHLNTEMHDGD